MFVVVSVLTACAGGSGDSSAPALRIPLATSVATDGGTWATVAMGNLDDPANTFWQVLFRPERSSRWSDQVPATGTATNGGVVLAATGAALTVGVRPYDLLTFSPVVTTADDGRVWTPGLIQQGLIDTPDSLSTGLDGAAVALVQGGGGSQVVTAGTDRSTWTPLATQSELMSSPQSAPCGISALEAVAVFSSQPVIGAACSRPGVAGIFTRVPGGSWRLTGPGGVPLLEGATVQVLSLSSTPAGLDALLAVRRGGATQLVAASTTSTDPGSWRLSAGLPLPEGAVLTSIVDESGKSLLVLMQTSPGSLQLDRIDGPGSSWIDLPPPPAGTATVAPAPEGGLSALSVDHATLTDWELTEGAAGWTKGQVLNVNIEYGSSG
jgi:hypothetical protein